MSRKDNLKKYSNMLHQAATKAAPNEEVTNEEVIVEKVTVITVTKSLDEDLVEVEVTEPSESLSHKGVFPDTLDEDEDNNNLFKGVFPDTIED